MPQEKLSTITIISIRRGLDLKINFQNVTDKFETKKNLKKHYFENV
jgi:hypothetical protein